MGRDSSCSMHTFQRLSNATIIILDFVVWTLLSCTKINDINEPLFRVLRFVVPNLPLDWLWNRYYYSHFPNALVCCNVYQHYSAQSQSKVTFSPPTNVSETQNHQIRDTDRLSRKWWWTINHCTKKNGEACTWSTYTTTTTTFQVPLSIHCQRVRVESVRWIPPANQSPPSGCGGGHSIRVLLFGY